MDLQKAVAVARRQIETDFAAEAPRDVRLESFLYDDHLMVWSLTIGFALADRSGADSGIERTAPPPPRVRQPADQARCYKIVRVSETDKSVLSIADR